MLVVRHGDENRVAAFGGDKVAALGENAGIGQFFGSPLAAALLAVCLLYTSYQMPVEECGNMLIMLEAARAFGADKALADQYRSLLDNWVKYLVQYGEDPAEQLCTDDFAGHLAHNCLLYTSRCV